MPHDEDSPDTPKLDGISGVSAGGARKQGVIDLEVTGKFTLSKSVFMGYDHILTGKYGEVEIEDVATYASVQHPSLTEEATELSKHWALLTTEQKAQLQEPIDLVKSPDKEKSKAGVEMLKKVSTEALPKAVVEIIFRIIKGDAG